ncbi:ATP-binding protein [Streptomyces chryseus]|uniref:ATP-binding protein n=1 Tax=Streptomyces chryseus TaxID=68186 RepID=UPI001E426001|nr:ATP-binding protein [Streptomyces chryseus]
MNETTQLPLVRERFYRRDRRSVPAAREFARWALRDWSIGERADDVLLCVSELATNALVHGVPAGRGFLFALRYGEEVLRIEVHDSGSGLPQIREPDGESGRGLLLVAALADKWGVGEREPGKIVWCEFAVVEGGAPSCGVTS